MLHAGPDRRQTTDRRQTSPDGRQTMVVISQNVNRRQVLAGHRSSPVYTHTHTHTHFCFVAHRVSVKSGQTSGEQRPPVNWTRKQLDRRRPETWIHRRHPETRRPPETSETRRRSQRHNTACLLVLVHWTSQCSWRNNNRTATSVVCRWINASVTRVVDHPRGYVISRWTAAWIALHWISDSVARVNNYLRLHRTVAGRKQVAQIGSRSTKFGNSDYRLSTTGLHHLKTAVEQQDNSTGLQLPTTATTSHGQQTRGYLSLRFTTAMDINYQPSSSHSTGTSTNVHGCTSDEVQHSSIYASAGAQLRNTDKASRTDVNWKSAAHDTQTSTSGDIGSTESRLATLRGQLDFNEVDDFASSNVDSFGQRSAPPSASASGESSAGHPNYASPERPKVVDVNLQVDLDSCSIEGELVTCQTDAPNRFRNI